MKIYLDLIFLINFGIDFLIILTLSLILRRNIKVRRMILGSVIGALSIFLLFINLSSIFLIMFKVIISCFIIIVTFGYKDIKYFINNLLYFYTISIILGGFLYYLNIEFSYKNAGIIFFNKGLSINFIFLIIVSPIILYIYIKQAYRLKRVYSLNYEVDLYLKSGKIINLNGYMDTANNLVEPYKKRAVIIINDKKIIKEVSKESFILVPYDTVDSHGILKCIIPNKIYVKGLGVMNNIVVGITSKDFKMDGVNCILNNLMLEGKND